MRCLLSVQHRVAEHSPAAGGMGQWHRLHAGQLHQLAEAPRQLGLHRRGDARPADRLWQHRAGFAGLYAGRGSEPVQPLLSPRRFRPCRGGGPFAGRFGRRQCDVPLERGDHHHGDVRAAEPELVQPGRQLPAHADADRRLGIDLLCERHGGQPDRAGHPERRYPAQLANGLLQRHAGHDAQGQGPAEGRQPQ